MNDSVDPLDLDALLAHREYVARVAQRVLHDHAAADDVVQETWLAAMKQPPGKVRVPRNWLARVARNVAVSMLRKRRRSADHEHAAARREAVPSASDVAARFEAHRAVVDAVAALPEPLRETVVLRFFENRPPRAIAARHGISVNTVRSRLRRASELLRDALESRYGDDRRAWIVALAPLAASPLATGGTATTAGNALLRGGGIAMRTKTAVTVGALVLLLLIGGGLSLALRGTDAPSGGEGGDGSSHVATATDTRSETRHGRDRVAAATDTPPTEDAPADAVVVTRSVSVSTASVSVRSDPRPPGAGESEPLRTTGPVRIKRDAPSAYGDEGALRITVVDGYDGPRTDVRVRASMVIDGENKTLHKGPVGTSGRTDIGPLPEGSVKVYVSLGDVERSTRTRIVAGLLTELTIEMPGGATVEGAVSHRTRGVLAGVRVSGGAHIRRGGGEGAFHDSFTTTTDSDGNYRVRGVPTGTHQLSVQSAEIGWSRTPRDEVTIEGARTVRHDIVLGRVSLSGSVIDAETRAPIAGATVRIQAPLFVSATTDAVGRYELIDLPPGTYRMTVTHDGHGLRFVDGPTIESGEARSLDIELQAAATIEFHLTDENGAPITGRVQVGLEGTESGKGTDVGTSMTADDDGVATFARAVPASYQINLSTDDTHEEAVAAEIAPGRNVLAVTLRRKDRSGDAVLLEGVVRDKITGRGIAGVRVSPKGPATLFAMTGADGTFTLRGRGGRGGSVGAVFLGKDGYGAAFVSVPKDAPFVAELTPAAVLKIHVRRPGGALYSGDLTLGISAREDGGTSLGTGATADEHGLAVYRRIVPGRYKLGVRAGGVGRADLEITVQAGENVIWVDLE